MAAKVTFDTVQGSKLELEGQTGRFTRMATVTGVPITPGQEFEALWTVAGLMPTLSSTCPGHPTLQLIKEQVVPLSQNAARVALIYETPSGFIPTTYLITNSTFLSSVQTNLIPGTKVPIRPSDWINVANFADKVIADNVTIQYLRPTRQLDVSLLRYGSPNDALGDYVGCVNDKAWQGKPKGYWLMSNYETQQYVYQGYYSVKASVQSRVIEDWSETGILYNTMVGKYVEVDAADIAALNASPYAYGIIGAPPQEGIVRAGPYPLADFLTIFGF